jgi:hypothetical protein
MRHILVDHAHRRSASKRGGNAIRVALDTGAAAIPDRVMEVLALDSWTSASRLLDPGRVPADAPATRAEIRLMTPEYASPEQVRGEAITTATDVYQLGILLYELLSGRHPHPLRAASPAEIERIVYQTDPALPSVAAIDGRGSTPSEVARQRGTDARRLRRQLRGDLDTIARTALQKEPERRYASVEQFVDDLERYLGGRPILARRDSHLYRARKLVRRHPLGAVAAVLAALTCSSVRWSFAAGNSATSIPGLRPRCRTSRNCIASGGITQRRKPCTGRRSRCASGSSAPDIRRSAWRARGWRKPCAAPVGTRTRKANTATRSS